MADKVKRKRRVQSADPRTQHPLEAGKNNDREKKNGPAAPNEPTSVAPNSQADDAVASTHSGSSPSEISGGSPGVPSKRNGEKRGSYSLETKAHVLDLLQNKKMKLSHLARQFNIPERTIRNFKSHAEKIKAALENPNAGRAKKTRGPQYPEIDRHTMELVETARAEGLPVVRSTIQTFGAKARDAAVAKAQTDKDRAKYEGFTASIHWAKNFIVRNNLSKTRPHGIGDEGNIDATLGRQDPPQEAGTRNGIDEGGPGNGDHPPPDEGGTGEGNHPAPEGGKEEEEQNNAFDEGDPNQPVADHADGSTSRPGADSKKTKRGAGGGAKKAPVPPPYADVADHFGRLEATAGECAMERVSHFLRLAKMEWIDEFEKRKGRQTDIRDFFSSK